MRTGVVERVLDPAALLAEVQRASNGASILFVGTVRDVHDGRAVTGMEYSSYASMASRELERIGSEAADSFGTLDIVVEHRVGKLELGDASVVIAVAHPHRSEAFEAARFVIEQIKLRVPIWKKEHYVDGTREWIDPTRARSAAEKVGS